MSGGGGRRRPVAVACFAVAMVQARLRARKRVKSVRDYYWMGAIAAQKLAGGRKPVERGHRVRSIVGGIALALLIGGGLFLLAVLNG